MLHRNGKEIEQIFRNGREIALLYRNGVIIYDKRRQEEPSVVNNYTITYVNGETNANITGNLPSNDTVTGDTYTIPSTGTLEWTNHNLLGYSETQYPNYNDIATVVHAPGDEITVDHNMTLYPVWNVNFQGLIDEGYVTMVANNGYYDNNIQAMRVATNHYPKELVADFNDVFISTNNKKVSSSGVVGEGTKANLFLHDQANLWLTDNEWCALYSNSTMPYWPQNNQFTRLDWSSNNTATFTFRGSGTPFNNAGGSQNTFFRNGKGPDNLILDFGTNTIQRLNVAFKHSNTNTFNTENITFVGTNGNPVNVIGSMQGTFENCSSLRTISGIDISGAINEPSGNNAYGNTFQLCSNLVTIPSSISSTGETNTSTACTGMPYMFSNCSNLTEIGVILNMANINNNANMFDGDTKLETVYLKGINAGKNGNIDLSMTKISASCVNYIVDNLTEIDTTVDGFVWKNLYLPSISSLTNEQLIRLQVNGWNCYINGTLTEPTGEKNTLVYNLNGGDFGPDTLYTFRTTAKVSNVAPIKVGYTFTGWTDQNGNSVSAGDVISIPNVLTASWIISEIHENITYSVTTNPRPQLGEPETSYRLVFSDSITQNAIINSDRLFEFFNEYKNQGKSVEGTITVNGRSSSITIAEDTLNGNDVLSFTILTKTGHTSHNVPAIVFDSVVLVGYVNTSSELNNHDTGVIDIVPVNS